MHTSSDDAEKRPARVNFFAKHSIQVGDVQHTAGP